jgi:hypothetical protein
LVTIGTRNVTWRFFMKSNRPDPDQRSPVIARIITLKQPTITFRACILQDQQQAVSRPPLQDEPAGPPGRIFPVVKLNTVLIAVHQPVSSLDAGVIT